MKSVKFAFFLVIAISTVRSFGQTTNESQYIEFYRKGQYSKAVSILKNIVKKTPDDAIAWHYLGLSYMNLEDQTAAVRALEKAVKLRPDKASSHAGLAYAYFVLSDKRAGSEANKSLELEPNNAEVHYILGALTLYAGNYDVALSRANKAIQIDPNMSNAYLLRSNSLLGKYATTNFDPSTAKERRGYLIEAAKVLDDYYDRVGRGHLSRFNFEHMNALRFFSAYFEKKDHEEKANSPNPEAEQKRTPYKILSKPPATYSSKARESRISGTVQLMVDLTAEGSIGHILALRSLGYGLDEQAIASARKIKFLPTKVDGVPVSTVVTIEYGFTTF